MNVSIYIKSSFRGNPRGAGEAAAVIEFIDKQGKSHKRQQRTQIEADTKNALHLKICIAAMRVLLKPCDITVFIDCDYMANACRLGWLDKWQQDGWKKANGKPPANVEEWKQFWHKYKGRKRACENGKPAAAVGRNGRPAAGSRKAGENIQRNV